MDPILVPHSHNPLSPRRTTPPVADPTATPRAPVVVWMQRLLLPPVVRVRLVLLLGFLGALIVVITAPVRREAAPSWRLTLPFVPHPGHAVFSFSSFIVGMGLRALPWTRLAAVRSDRPHTR